MSEGETFLFSVWIFLVKEKAQIQEEHQDDPVFLLCSSVNTPRSRAGTNRRRVWLSVLSGRQRFLVSVCGAAANTLHLLPPEANCVSVCIHILLLIDVSKTKLHVGKTLAQHLAVLLLSVGKRRHHDLENKSVFVWVYVNSGHIWSETLP